MTQIKRLGILLTLVFIILLAGCGGTKTITVAKPPQVLNPVHLSPNFGVPPPGFKLPRPSSSSSILMYDDVTISRIPSNAPAVAGYASGPYANYTAMTQAFPHAYHISIATNAGARAQCLDVEPGDATASEAPGWVHADMAAGFRKPCIYASISNMPSVKYYLSKYYPRSAYFLWDAGWTFSPHLDAGYDATQWYGGNVIDKSQATLDFLRRGGPPPPPPGPSPKQIAHWQSARNSSFSAYHNRNCSDPLTTRAHCNVYGQRVYYFQYKLWHKYPRWHCWGPGARTTTPVCWILRPEVSIWSQKRDSSRHAFNHVHGGACLAATQPPSPPPICSVLEQRIRYFSNRIKQVFY